MSLKGSKTEENLKEAFAGESQANRRYLYFAQKADIEGYNDVAAVFRSTAEGETGHAHGHLEYLEEVGDPGTGMPIGETKANLASAVQGETHEYTDMYPGMAKTAREEGSEEIADWFETLAKAEKSHAGKFQKKGYLKEISIHSDKSYFDTNTSAHHHFYDEDTNELIDCDESDIDKINIRKNITGKKINSVEVLVRVASDNQTQK